ncbi:MAG TPA: YkgJ family cysteine cluster protein [Rhizomicrobium sp.]
MSHVVALTRDYPCHMGGPVLRHVDTRIFGLRYFMNCMACTFCNDICCSYGVDVDLENVARLRAAPQAFKDYVGVPESEWFTDEVIRDAEFPSGKHVRTQVRNGRCVFLNREARGCKIHSFSLDNGLDYHLLKPMVSVLFPLTFEHGVLVASNEVLDKSLICEGAGPTAYEGSRGELLYYFGEALVAELDGLNNAQS